MTAIFGSGSLARRPRLTPRFSSTAILPAVDRSIVAAVAQHRYLGGKASVRNWETWSSLYNWRERGLASDSDHASRRRIRRGDALERAQDDIANMSRAALAKLLPLLQPTDAGGIDPYQIPLSQIPSWMRTLADLQLKSLGYEDRVALTGKDGGPVKVETKTQHVFQPPKEVWDDILRIRAEVEKLSDGDTDEDTVPDSL